MKPPIGEDSMDALMKLRIVGIDEVGRGCWAGPLVVGAVILDKAIDGLNDSKKLSARSRIQLNNQILDNAHTGLGWVWPEEIDQLGLTKSTTLGIKRALVEIRDYDHIIIDGSFNYLPDHGNVSTLVSADSLIPAVSAASILAKVARDKYMHNQALLYPNYGFERHVGYGTKFHIDALSQFGITRLHRKSYKPLLQYI